MDDRELALDPTSRTQTFENKSWTATKSGRAAVRLRRRVTSISIIVARLMTIPDAGHLTALASTATLDDSQRFE
jgi:hypothetical protein